MSTTIQNPPTKNQLPGPEEESNGRQMSFLEHLEELRVRLLRSIYSIIITTGICFYFRDAIYGYLAKPLTDALHALNIPGRQRHSQRAQKARPKFTHASRTKATVTGKPQVTVFAPGFS